VKYFNLVYLLFILSLLGACIPEARKKCTDDQVLVNGICEPKIPNPDPDQNLDCGALLNHQEETRIMYQNSSVGSSDSCLEEVQKRSCENGQLSTWSGSFQFASCSNERVRYAASSVAAGLACQTEVQRQICQNGICGTWSPNNFGYTSCQVQGYASCGNIPHNGTESRIAYSAASVPYGQLCSAIGQNQTRTCNNGSWSSWSGSYQYLSCSVQGAASCGSVPHNGTESRVAYSAASVAYGQLCSAIGQNQTRTCNNGSWSSWSGSYQYLSCSVQGAASCGSIASGGYEIRTMYQAAVASESQSCVSETQNRLCTNGQFSAWSGSYTQTECVISRIRYESATAINGMCNEETQQMICSSGVCGVWNPNRYTNSSCHVGAWIPPIGIPSPSWPNQGIDIARPSFPTPWTADQSGWYYVSATGCSDSRTYGHPGSSRCSLPSAPLAGSVIVLNGIISKSQALNYNGTTNAPIWIIGYDPESKPQLTGAWSVNGSYLIFDSLHWNATNLSDINLIDEGNHNMYRNCLFRNTQGTSYGAGIGAGGNYLVFYRITVYDQGNWQASTDVDRHGVKVYAGSNMWFVDSSFYHNQGDGIQVGDANNTAAQINKIYIGRNTSYENLQSGLWTKNATDVIMSQNIVYGINYSNGGDGQGMGGQYDPKHVWFINNIIHNTKAGIKISGADFGSGGPWYAIGNLIYNIESDQGTCNNYNVGALAYRNNGGFTAIFNTVFNADVFVAMPSGAGGNIRIANNIFSVKDSSSNNCTPMSVDVSWAHDYNLVSDASWITDAHKQSGSAASTFINPGIDFTLLQNSSAKDKANSNEEAAFAAFQSRYGIDIRKDINGRSRPQNLWWDIGAYEF